MKVGGFGMKLIKNGEMKINKPLPKVIVRDNTVFYGKSIIGIAELLPYYVTDSSEHKTNFKKYKEELSHVFQTTLKTYSVDAQSGHILFEYDAIYMFILNPEHVIYK